jgi:hypothetical protein
MRLVAKSPVDYFLDRERTFAFDREILEVAFESCSCDDKNLATFLTRARRLIPPNREPHLLNLVRRLWAHGFAEPAALLALAVLPHSHPERSSWPFLDLGCQAIADFFLLPQAINRPTRAEIWLAWGIYTQSWDKLPTLAQLAPSYIAQDFLRLATAATTRDRSFREFEATFDYGRMIAPWNHFNLAWLATRLGDRDAALAHLEKLCTSSEFGEVRTGRFLNRLVHWPIFKDISQQIRSQIESARARLKLSTIEHSIEYRSKLNELWPRAAER